MAKQDEGIKAENASKVDRNTAEAEVTKWLDNKKIKETKRATMIDNIDILIEAIQDGVLTLGEDFVLTQTLDFPIESGDNPVTTLSYKPRLAVSEAHAKQKGVKANDIDGRLVGYISALTGKPGGVIRQLDSQDYSIAGAIAVFFL